MSDLGKNIQRIAKTDDLQRQINDLQNAQETKGDKAPIDGSRSIAYNTPGGGYGNQNGKAGQTQLLSEAQSGVSGALGELATNLEDVFSDLGGTDGTGELTENTLGDAFDADLQDLFDGDVQIGDQLNGLTGLFECGTSNEGEIRMDGIPQPPEIEGLEDYNGAPETNPKDEGFEEGTLWEALSVSSAWTGHSPYLAARDYIDYVKGPPLNFTGATLDSVYDNTAVSDQWSFDWTAGDGSAQNTNQPIHGSSSCTVDVDANCPSEASLLQWTWDARGVHQLVYDGAQFNTSSLENASDLIPQWENNPSSISGCTSGGEPVTITPRGDGSTDITFSGGSTITTNDSNIVINITS